MRTLILFLAGGGIAAAQGLFPPVEPERRDEARVLLVGVRDASVVLDDRYVTHSRVMDEGFLLELAPGAHRLRVQFPDGHARETQFRAGARNLLVLRAPDFRAPVLPHPNEPVAVGSLKVSGTARLTVPGLDVAGLEVGGSREVVTRFPAGRFEAEWSPYGGNGTRFALEVIAGKETLLVPAPGGGAPEQSAGHRPMPVDGGGYDRAIPGLDLDLAWVPPGSFAKAEARSLNAISRARSVRIEEGYWMGRTEITQTQWRQIMDRDPSYARGPDRPVNQVSWVLAREFCRRLTSREAEAGRLPAGYVYELPTEAQWEHACRAGDARESLPEREVRALGWVFQTGGQHMQAVGLKAENTWGMADMIGNVSEWCLDWEAETVSVDGQPRAPFQNVAAVRGGSHASSFYRSFRFSDHEAMNVESVSDGVGFRIVLTRQPPVPPGR